MKRLLTLSVITGLSVFAIGFGPFAKVFDTTYSIKKDSALGKAGCGTCHAGKMGGKLNGYGNDLKEAMAGSKKITPEALKKIEAKDSDGDGVKNIDEIKKDTNPGVKG
jgi:hypothetical protein